MTVFEVEGCKGRYVISEFGYPPIPEPRRCAEDDGWEDQPGLFGERAWVGIRAISGPAEGLVSYVNAKHKKFTPVGIETREVEG